MRKVNINELRSIISQETKLVLEKFKHEPFTDFPNDQDDNVDFAKVRSTYDDMMKLMPNAKKEDILQNIYGELKKKYIGKVKSLQSDVTKNMKKRASKMDKDPVSGEKWDDNSRFYFNTEKLNLTDSEKKHFNQSKSNREIKVSGKTFSYGNSKLPPSTMIVNMTSALNCPSTECPFHVQKDENGKLLSKGCYAVGGEKRFPNLTYRNLRNQEAFKRTSLKDILRLLDFYIQNAPHRIKNIRLHEDGDFPTVESVELCNKLAKRIYEIYNIRTTAYTYAIKPGFDEAFANADYIIVNSSSKKLKNVDRYHFAKPNTFMKKLDKSPGIHERKNNVTGEWEKYFYCHCDCCKCNFCYQTREENGEDKPTEHTKAEDLCSVYTLLRK